ncbi:MAG TPA: hypothetical protein VFZ00_01015 [Solirubrobacter sp.]|nr:hypothetical protein [Solirubrobacter sp.]
MQWEFPGRLGPPPGRYVVRRFAGDDVREVIIVGMGEAPRRIGRREPPGTVPVTRVTIVDAEPVDEEAAAAWLRDAEPGEPTSLAHLLSAYRIAAVDPFAPDADPTRALALRLGYGSGGEVAEGRWTAAREFPVPERVEPRKRSKHRPADRLAAVLAGRDAVLACEELALRARADLDLGRSREAALQLEAALGAAVSELAGWVSHGDLEARLGELRGYRESVAGAAAAAREGRLEPSHVESVSVALARLEAALRARAIYAAEA